MLRSQVDAHVPVNQEQEGYNPTFSTSQSHRARGIYANASEWYDREFSDSSSDLQTQWGATAPIAMPCPWRYIWTPWGATISIDGTRFFAFYDHFTAASWATLDAASYAVLVDGTATGEVLFVKSLSRDYERTSYNVAYWRVTIDKASPTDVITATLTIGGTDGYTITRTFGALDKPVFFARTPIAWDEKRTVTLTWTGGGTTATMDPVRPARWRMLKRGALPAGWTACSAPRGTNIGTLNTNGVRYGLLDLPDINVIDNYNDGSNKQDGLVAPGTIPHLFIGNASTRAMCTQQQQTQFSTTEIVRPSHRFAPWTGIPFYDGTDWKRYLSNRSTGNTNGENRLQKAVNIVQVRFSTTAVTVTIDVQRNADWQIGGTGTTVISDSWSHAGGSTWQAYEVPASYPLGPNADGAYDGAVTGLDRSGGFITLEDPVPLPFDIPVSDGDVIPGAYHPDGVVDAAGLTPVEVVGDTLDYTDIPASPGQWRGIMTALDPGVYRLRAFTAANVDTARGGTMHDNNGVGWTSESMCVLNGRLDWRPDSTNTNGWPSYGKNNRTDRTWQYVKAVKYDITPYALSAGANELNTNATTWGVAAPSNNFLRAPLFCKYTAATAGVHTFAMNVIHPTHRAAPWCAYLSATDQYASHDQPDVMDAFTGLGVPAILATAPPTAGNGFLCYVVDGVGTGEFAGHDNEIAIAEGNGTAGNTTYDWRFFEPTVGMMADDEKVWDGSAWVTRGDVLQFRRNMAVGETVFMRIQHYPRNRLQVILNGLYPVERWTSVDGAAWAISMTVSPP